MFECRALNAKDFARKIFLRIGVRADTSIYENIQLYDFSSNKVQ